MNQKKQVLAAFDGILGMAFQSISVTGLKKKRLKIWFEYFFFSCLLMIGCAPVFYNISKPIHLFPNSNLLFFFFCALIEVAQNLVPQPIFAFWLNRNDSNPGGELTIGGIDQSHYTGSITYVPLASET